MNSSVMEKAFDAYRRVGQSTIESKTHSIQVGLDTHWIRATYDDYNPTPIISMGWRERGTRQREERLTGKTLSEIMDCWEKAFKASSHRLDIAPTHCRGFIKPTKADMKVWVERLVDWSNKQSPTRFTFNDRLSHSKVRGLAMSLGAYATLRPEIRKGQVASMLVDFSFIGEGGRKRKRYSITTYEGLNQRWGQIEAGYQGFIREYGLAPDYLLAPLRCAWDELIQSYLQAKT